MKRWIAGMLVVAMVAFVLALPAPAAADSWRHGHRGGGGRFWGGLAVGAVTGLVVGSIIAAPRVYAAPPVVYQAPPVVYQPAPVYAVPAPVCTTYWRDTYWNGYGWTPGHWEQACR